MSTEVKPSLTKETSSSSGDGFVNTWLDNFPNGYWADAEGRDYVWIVSDISYTPNSKAYEYKVKFDTPVSNFVINFPFVVKTSDYDINNTAIENVRYNVRSYENYGTSFIISGSSFSFKVATRYKLSDQDLPILRLYYNSNITFLNKNTITVNPQGRRTISPAFNNENLIYVFLHDRDVFPVFYNKNSMKVFIPTVLTNTSFVNINNSLVNILRKRNINPTFLNGNNVFVWLYGLYTSVDFYTKQVMDVINLDGYDLFSVFLTSQKENITLDVWRFINASYTNSNTLNTSLIKQVFIAPVFTNENTASCSYTRAHISQSVFINSQNMLILCVANCYATDWSRFGGMWIGCQTWTT
jgi:hypothetical protein